MAQCITPFTAKTNDMTKPNIPVPCGKCPNCVARRVSAWSFRLMQQDKISTMSNFITLTYDTDHVPITRNGFMSLDKRHYQLFIKRLRKSHGAQGSDIKYFAAAEYGTKTLRPHLHVILFNADVLKVEACWDYGSIHVGSVSGASIGYSLKYMSKPSKVPLHRNDDRLPEFRLMSKGLGKNYLTPQIIEWHKNDLDNRVYCNLEEGKKISMPRYYKDKIYTEMERKRVAFLGEIKAREVVSLDKRTTHEVVESHKAAFKRMYKNSIKDDKM